MQTGAVIRENAKWHKAIHENAEEYLTIAETAARLKLSPKTIKNKMAAGMFKKGVHYFSPAGMAPRFKWSAVVSWLEHTEVAQPEADIESIPMARGYRLGEVPVNGKSLLDKGQVCDVLSG
jgi:hypothetical protein